jgi:ferredoxin-thioredoxin reductase catalytic subunit
MEDVNTYLIKYSMIENPNEKVVNSIRERLSKNGNHCPCVSPMTNDTICPCKAMRETGNCCCRLYVKKEIL